jgi:cob(I)alamin adenosyltransferase
VRITKVYTRSGDGGETHLGGGQKIPKDSPRIEALGTVDELNSVLGLALAAGLAAPISEGLRRVQNELFNLGAELCVLEEDKPRVEGLRIEGRHVEKLEAEMEGSLARLGPLKEFVLPGGSAGAAWLHLARTVCRRAERLVVALSRKEPVSPSVLAYLNRLSDWLFVLARVENEARGAPGIFWEKSK